jgi:hypothetical protein
VPSASPATPDLPTPDEVQRIAAVGDPVVRNLQITECYSRLAAAMGARGDPCSNWCTFATWASRQAGRTIRGEDLLAELQRELGRDAEVLHPVDALWRTLVRRGLFNRESRLGRLVAELHTPFDAFELASDAVARGNRKVFAEIGLEFARFLNACDADAAPDSADLAAFLDGLRPGDPPDGQRYLRQAFTRYQQQRFEPDAGVRAQLVVLANLEIGLHEQTRLQPEIGSALDAAASTEETLSGGLLRRLLGAVVQRRLTRVSRVVITRSFMVLTLPGAVLALGRNLDAPFPEALRTPTDAELEEVLARFEPAAGALDDCGAEDWAQLKQRMHYIAHLFRAYHEIPALGSAPFTEAQLERIRAGVVPDGEL